MLRILVHIILILPIITSSWFYESYELPKFLLFLLCCIPISIWSIIQLTHKTIVILRGKKNISELILPYTYIIFIGTLCIASFTNETVLLGLWGQPYRYQGTIFLLCCGGLAYFVSNSHSERLREYARTIAIVGIVSCIVVIVQYLALNIFHVSIPAYAGRPIGTFGNPNFAAGYIALSYAFVWVWNRDKVIRIFCILLYSTAIVCTGSLSAIGSFIVICVVLFASKSPRKLVGMLLIIGLVGVGMYQSYSSRTPSSFDRRSIIWEKAWLAFLQKPFTGWGIENFNTALQSNVRPEEIHLTHIRVDKAHNELLEVLVAGGIVSLALYIALIFQILKIAYLRTMYSRDPTTLAVLVGYMVYSLANVQATSQYILIYISVGILLATTSRPSSS